MPCGYGCCERVLIDLIELSVRRARLDRASIRRARSVELLFVELALVELLSGEPFHVATSRRPVALACCRLRRSAPFTAKPPPPWGDAGRQVHRLGAFVSGEVPATSRVSYGQDTAPARLAAALAAHVVGV